MPMPLDVYANDAHLRAEDAELFLHADKPWLRLHRLARQDLYRDLLGRGIDLDLDGILNGLAPATVTLTFTAGDGGQLVVPAGTIVCDVDPTEQTHGVVRFATESELVVEAEETGEVEATALDPGEPGNVAAGALVWLEGAAPTNFASVTNAEAAEDGADHQVTRAAVYRAMELVYQDLMRLPDDAFDARRRIYQKAYAAELDRIQAAGLLTSVNILEGLPGVVGSADRWHGANRLERS